MAIEEVDLEQAVYSAFKKTKCVYQQYLLEVPSREDVLDMDYLQRSVECYTEHKIYIKKVDWNPVQIKGRIDRYVKGSDKFAEIIISEKLNTCWTRFVACKEMCHLIIDTEDKTIDSRFQIADAQTAKTVIDEMIAINNIPPHKISLPAFSELIAKHCAIELLFPSTRRLEALNELEKLDSPSRQHLVTQLAHRYKLPKYHVDQSLKPIYMGFWGKFAQDTHTEVFGN